MSNIWAVYNRGKASGSYYRTEVVADSAEHALQQFVAVCSAFYEPLAVEDGSIVHSMNPEERTRYLLRGSGTAAVPEGQTDAAAPACGMECWRDKELNPIDTEHAMRMVRLACGGDPDKGRRRE